MEAVLHHDSERLTVGTYGPLVFSRMANVTAADLDWVERAIRQTAAKYSQSSMVVYVTKASTTERDQLLRRSADLSSELGSLIGGLGIVIDGSALDATLIRATISAYFFLVRQSSPSKVFASIEDSLGWLKKLPKQPEDFQLVEARTLNAWLTRPARQTD
jgi:hypothetical protein